MDVVDVLLSLLLVSATVLCAVAIWSLIKLADSARSVKRLADDLDERVVPLVEKADVTLDAFNAELLRIDMIVSRVEDVTERVSTTSHTVQDIVNAPVEMVNDVAGRVRRAWRSRQEAAQARREAPGADESTDTMTEQNVDTAGTAGDDIA